MNLLIKCLKIAKVFNTKIDKSEFKKLSECK